MARVTRRRFLQSAAAAGTALPLVTAGRTKASARVLGANDRIRVAVAGINGRGKSHIDAFGDMQNVDVTYLVDPDSSLFDPRSSRVRDRGGNDPKCEQDIRRVLDDPDVDVVSVATCNHWHSLITIWACQAGKDVYVEKPLSHNVFEGRQAVAAARKYDRIVQHGTQNRSSPTRAREIAAVQSGKYGPLRVSKGYCCKPRWSIESKPIKEPPAHLDFDLWLGPAPEQPFHENLVHYNWHWFWDTGNGDIGNQGVHEMDLARWAIAGGTMPNKVHSLGGRYGYDDQGQTPNTQMAVFEYDDALLVFEVRGLVERETNIPRKVGNEYYTDEGMITGGKFYPRGSSEGERLESFDVSVNRGGPFGSFINAVRSHSVDDLNADVLEGHYSSALCHLANVSYRLGQDVPFNQAASQIDESDPVVAGAHEALAHNLRDGLGLELADLDCRVGRSLDINPEAERFVNDAEADAHLTRPYREPYVVPAEV